MLIVLDTNVWISERLFLSGTGAAFLYILRQVGGKILLPNVTQDEVIATSIRQGMIAVNKIKNSYVTI